MAVVSLKINADSSDAQRDVQTFNKSTDTLKTKFRSLQKEFTKDGVNKYTTKIDKLKSQYNLLGEGTSGLRKTQSFLRAELTKLINKGVDPTDTRVELLAQEYKKLAAQSKKNVKANKGLKISFTSLATAGVAVAGAIATVRGVASSFAGAFQSSRSFSKEIKNVTTLTDKLTFDEIKEGIKELPSILGTATDLTNGLYQAISAGVDPARAINFVGESAKFAKAALTDTATATDVLTTALNAYGLNAGDAGKVSDIFFQTIKSGKTTGEELASSLGKSIPLYAATGIELEELSAGLATMTLSGIGTAEATTKLNAIVKSFLNPTDDLTEALANYGYESGGAFLKAEKLSGALAFLQKETDGSAEKTDKLMRGTEALQGVMALSAEGGEQFREALLKIENGLGATDDAFSKQIDSIDIAMASVDRLKLAFGEFLEDALIYIAPSIEKMADVLKDLDFSKVAKGVTVAGGAFVGFKTAVLLSKGAVIGLKGALVSSGIGIALVVLGSAVGLVMDKFMGLNKMGKLPKLQKGLADAQTKLASLQDDLANVGNQAGPRFSGTVDSGTINKSIKETEDKIADLTAQIKELGDVPVKVEDEVCDVTTEVADAVEKITKDYDKVIEGLEQQLAAARTAATNNGKKTGDTPTDPPTSTGSKCDEVYEELSCEEQAAQESLRIMEQKAAEAKLIRDKERDNIISGFSVLQDSISTSLGGYSTIMHGLVESSLVAFEAISNEALELQDKILLSVSAGIDAVGSLVTGIGQLTAQSLQQDNKRKSQQDKIEAKRQKKLLEEQKSEALAKATATITNEQALALEKQRINEAFEKKQEEVDKEVAMKAYEREKAVFETAKAFQLVNIAINTASAIIKSWALNPLTGPVMAAVIGGVGAAQLAIVAAQQPPDPPAFRGGTVGDGFIVPQGYDNDNFPLRVSSGERVEVTPLGETEDEETGNAYINVYIDGKHIQSAITGFLRNKKMRAQ